jgi:hypothetical protein
VPKHTLGMKRLLFFVLLVFALFAGAAQARADDRSGGEVRVAGTCGRGAVATLRVREGDHGIETRFRLRQTRGRGLWRITIVLERRVAARATRNTTRRDDAFELRLTLRDFPGSDTVDVHAWGRAGSVVGRPQR